MRKARVALAAGINAVWVIPCLLLIRIIRPWCLVRMGTLISERSGHFVIDAALYLAQGENSSLGTCSIDLFWFREPTCNAQWARMVRRQMIARWWVRYLIFFNDLIPGGTPHKLYSTHGSRDIDGVLPRTSVRFTFLTKEDVAAKSWLYRHGWRDGEPFVCLLARDSAYLSMNSLHLKNTNDQSIRHSHRDTDIFTYSYAVQSLLNAGHWIIRMGKTAHERFPLHHSKLIDYPFADDQDDLLDIWLSANCSFFISTGTGIDMVPVAYGRPVVFVNYIPLSHLCSYANSLLVPKTLRWKNGGRALSLYEHLQHDYLSSEQYDRAGITVEDLSSSQIHDAVTECKLRLAGSWVETEEQRIRQSRFWEKLAAWPDFRRLHGFIHPESRIGSAWLESMGNAFLE